MILLLPLPPPPPLLPLLPLLLPLHCFLLDCLLLAS